MNKLLEFQKKVGAISKDSTNPFFKSRYFDINKLIEEVKPILNELGLVLLQPLDSIKGKPAIRTIIIDCRDREVDNSGKTINLNSSTEKILDYITILPENSDPQKMGSIITYYRRYAIQSLLFLQAEDDDGNIASNRKPLDKLMNKPVPQKAIIAKLIKEQMPQTETAEDYRENCMTLTGYELLPANYENIINSLR